MLRPYHRDYMAIEQVGHRVKQGGFQFLSITEKDIKHEQRRIDKCLSVPMRVGSGQLVYMLAGYADTVFRVVGQGVYQQHDVGLHR